MERGEHHYGLGMKNMKHGDILFGAIGTSATFGLAQVNQILACIAGVMTIIVMGVKLRKEWKSRNAKPSSQDD